MKIGTFKIEMINIWEMAYGENFYMDGPISKKSFNIFDDEYVKILLANKFYKKYLTDAYITNMDSEELLYSTPCDEHWNISNVENEIYKDLTKAINNSGADINVIKDIKHYGVPGSLEYEEFLTNVIKLY